MIDILQSILNYYKTTAKEKYEWCVSNGWKEEEAKRYAEQFEWHEVGIAPQKLNKLVQNGILKIAYKSSKHTMYTLAISLEELEALTTQKQVKSVTKSIDEYFDLIVGYDDLKQIIKFAIENEKSIHILLVGPPATAKTLFLEAIYNTQPNAEFVIGSSASNVGILKLVMERKPNILLIDEIDKILSSEDLSTLLSVMESGYVRRVKGDNITEVEKINLKVFAAANSDKKLPVELKSRLLTFYLKPYNQSEFMKVCIGFLVRMEGVSEEIAEQIAKFTYKLGGDVRMARHIARLAQNDLKKLEFIMNTVTKYTNVFKS